MECGHWIQSRPLIHYSFSPLNYKGSSTRHTRFCQVVRVLDEDNPIHVPMSLRARTSVLDLWLAMIKCSKSVLWMMIGWSWERATCVCGLLWFLVRYSCNVLTFRLSLISSVFWKTPECRPHLLSPSYDLWWDCRGSHQCFGTILYIAAKSRDHQTWWLQIVGAGLYLDATRHRSWGQEKKGVWIMGRFGGVNEG